MTSFVSRSVSIALILEAVFSSFSLVCSLFSLIPFGVLHPFPPRLTSYSFAVLQRLFLLLIHFHKPITFSIFILTFVAPLWDPVTLFFIVHHFAFSLLILDTLLARKFFPFRLAFLCGKWFLTR